MAKSKPSPAGGMPSVARAGARVMTLADGTGATVRLMSTVASSAVA